ncbi:hypothetical protein [Granulicella arctica]|uniref:hypothetical protein n=1 Tax=Granulicella arctica TaxID=940613 RepID=UPI0021E0DDC2|nr:hypothetical protein [Granulicella arctica]
MRKRDLARELTELDDEIERLELRRTSVVILMEVTAMLTDLDSNLLEFPVPSKITTSRPRSTEWLAVSHLPSKATPDERES